MAGQGYKVFSAGEVLTASNVNGYLMDQSVMRFADSATRASAIGTPTEGMVAYLDDTNSVEVFDGSNWVDFSGDITGITAGTALTGGGTAGDVTLDVDLSAVQIPTSQITDITATAAELNILDGVTATAAEINKLDGLTATTTELNYTDGVTSSIQTQINSKQDDVITTEGDLVIGNGSGNPVRLPAGSNGQVLTSNGTTASYQDISTGGLTLLSTTSISGSSEVNVTSIDQSYKALVILIDEFEASTSAEVKFAFRSGTDILNQHVTGKSSTSSIYRDGVTDFAPNLYTKNTSNVDVTRTIKIELWNYSEAKASPVTYHGFSHENVTANFYTIHYGGAVTEAHAINRFDLILSGGTFTDGTIRIYGAS